MTLFQTAIKAAVETFQSLNALEQDVERAADVIGRCLAAGGKLLVCGNGGSAADAADFATEFACRFATDRQPFPALNLAACGSLLSAIGNDYGFEEVFARQVNGFGRKGDVLVGITTSGNSGNVVAALKAAQNHELECIALLGRGGGAARGLGTVEFVVAGASTARIQEAHKFLLHVICEAVEARWLLKPSACA